MTLWIIVALIGLTYGASLLLAVRQDGLGRRRAPRSHPEWWEDAPLR